MALIRRFEWLALRGGRVWAIQVFDSANSWISHGPNGALRFFGNSFRWVSPGAKFMSPFRGAAGVQARWSRSGWGEIGLAKCELDHLSRVVGPLESKKYGHPTFDFNCS